MAAGARTQNTRWHWRVAVGGFFVMIGGSVPLSGMSFFHPYVMQDLFPTAAASFLLYYTVMILGIVFSMMFIGRNLLPKLGPKPLMYIGSVVVALALVGFSFCTANALTFYLAGALLGLGYGISFQLVPIVWVNNWFVEKKGTALGIVMGGTGLGGALWSFLIPMVSAAVSWRAAYLVAAVIVLIFPIPATMFLVRNTPAEVGLVPLGANQDDLIKEALSGPVEQPGFTYSAALRNPWLLLIFASVIVLGMVHGGAQILAVYLQGDVVYSAADIAKPLAERSPADTAFFSTLMMTWTLGLLVFKPLLGWMNDKIGILGAMLVTLGMQSLAFLWFPHMAYGQLLPLMFAAMVFMAAGMSNGTVQPPLLFANAAGPRDFAKIWSFFGTGYLVGMAVGAPIWGAIDDATGSYVLGFNLSPIFLIALTFTAYIGMKRGLATYTKAYREEHPELASSTA